MILFQVYEPYEDNRTYHDNAQPCFICYETLSDECPVLSLRHQPYYDKTCKCDGWIHQRCLEAWCKISSKCPICRMYVWERKTRANTAIISILFYGTHAVLTALHYFFLFIAYSFMFHVAISIYTHNFMKEHV